MLLSVLLATKIALHAILARISLLLLVALLSKNFLFHVLPLFLLLQDLPLSVAFDIIDFLLFTLIVFENLILALLFFVLPPSLVVSDTLEPLLPIFLATILLLLLHLLVLLKLTIDAEWLSKDSCLCKELGILFSNCLTHLVIGVFSTDSRGCRGHHGQRRVEGHSYH